jgi:nitrogen regulatory protein P-II 1
MSGTLPDNPEALFCRGHEQDTEREVKKPLMTKVQAVIREQQLEAVLERLELIGENDVTVTPVRGAGQDQSRREVFRGGAYKVDLVPKMLVEWYGPDERVDAVVRAIVQRAQTGNVGDGRIFLQHFAEAPPQF